MNSIRPFEGFVIGAFGLIALLIQVVVPIATLVIAWSCWRELKTIASRLPPAR